jgi:two-component system chemotaxis response regulator CheB
MVKVRMTDPLKVLVVDDNVDCRRLWSEVVAGLADTQVAAVASGRMALAKLRQERLDLILLDIDMPEMDGLQTLQKIRSSFQDAAVVMVGESDFKDADKVVEALQMGALDALRKVEQPCDKDKLARQVRLPLLTILGLIRSRKNMATIKALASGAGVHDVPTQLQVSNSGHKTAGKTPTGPSSFQVAAARLPVKVEAVAIGISTGGPNALAELIPKLPADLNVPIFIVQHMPQQLTAYLAASLDKRSPLTVREGTEGEEVLPNVVYIAPGGRHMVVRRRQNTHRPSGGRYIGLSNDPPENSCRPAVDVLFRSVAEAYDGDTLALVMTGMGSDGVKGVQAMKRKRCYCLTQSEESCVVYGMPRSVNEARLSDEQVGLDGLAERIAGIVHGAGRRLG